MFNERDVDADAAGPSPAATAASAIYLRTEEALKRNRKEPGFGYNSEITATGHLKG